MSYLLTNTQHTAENAFYGLLFALIIVFFLAAVATFIPRVKKVIEALAVFVKVSPAIVYVPIFIAMFGINAWPKILTAALISFYPMLIYAVKVDYPKRLSNQADMYSASEYQKVRYFGKGVYILSGITKGMVTSAPLAVIGSIVGDYVAGGTRPGGLGTAIVAANQSGGVLNLVIASTLLGFVFYVVADQLNKHVNKRFLVRAE